MYFNKSKYCGNPLSYFLNTCCRLTHVAVPRQFPKFSILSRPSPRLVTSAGGLRLLSLWHDLYSNYEHAVSLFNAQCLKHKGVGPFTIAS